MSNPTRAPEIGLGLTVNEVIRARPATVRVFDAHGIDSCCGGNLTLETVASRHSIDAAVLLRELEEVVGGT